MKKLSLFIACLFSVFGSFAQPFFTPIGDVTAFGTPQDGGYSINGGPCTGALISSAIWSTTPINFYHSFDLVFYANFTITTGSAPGADGICAVFGNGLNAGPVVGAGGGYLGYYDLSVAQFANSLGVEYDIFNNACGFNDPDMSCTSPSSYYDHIMIAENADVSTPLVPVVQADPATTNIKDGAFRKYELKWDCALQTLYVYCEGSLRTSYTFDPATKFGGVVNAQNVYWELTASSGSYCTVDTIKNITLKEGEICQVPCFDPTCRLAINPMPIGGCTWQFAATGICPLPGVIVTLYEWNFGDGSGNQYFTTNPVTHTFPGPGMYSVTVRVIAYNTKTGECCDMGPAKMQIRINCNGSGTSPDAWKTQEPEIPTAGKLAVFPNPVNTVLNVTTSEFEINNIRIYNMVGQKLIDHSCNRSSSEKINIQSLPNGTYIMEAADAAGAMHRTSFVVKK